MGSSWIFASAYKNQKATVQNRSTGDCIVYADDSLKAVILGIGNIQYKGDPDVEILKNNGMGILIPID